MRIAVLILFAAGLGIVAGGAVAQPKDGDLVLSLAGTSTTPPFTAYMEVAKPGVVRTIFSSASTETHSLVRMAANNKDMVLVVGRSVGSCLATVTPSGSGGQSTAAPVVPGIPVGFELDHDGTWVIATNLPSSPTWDGSMLLGLSGTQLQAFVTAFWYNNGGNSSHWWDDVAIDRDPGAFDYCVSQTFASGGMNISGLVAANRQSGISHGFGGQRGLGMNFELDPRTGDYVSVMSQGQGVLRASKNGPSLTISPLTGYFAHRGRITQDNHLWIAGVTQSNPRLAPVLLKFDLTRNAVVTLVKLNLPNSGIGWTTGLDVYGSRRLVCTQLPSSQTTVTVNVQSRHPLAGGKPYILGASFARRPGIKMPNGEWLDLDVAHALFWLTAQNLAPQTFVNFQGVLDGNGNNTKPIQVKIPPGLPKLNDMAVFVAGVIYDPNSKNQVIQVTNSHWFVLP